MMQRHDDPVKESRSKDEAGRYTSRPISLYVDNPILEHKSFTPPIVQQTFLQHTPPSKVADLRFLSSANFSSESVAEIPLTPNLDLKRFSVGNSPVMQGASHVRNHRPRPKSGIFSMETTGFAILEDGSPIQTTPRSNYGRYKDVSSPSRGFPSPQQQLRSTSPQRQAYRSTSPQRQTLRSTSPQRQNDQFRSTSPVHATQYSPFNFQPEVLNLAVKPAHRKGHKYKHSSVSMNLFQEPPPSLTTQQLGIPDLYPIPNFTESANSINHSQKLRLAWSSSHLVLSLIVFLVGIRYQILTLSTLAHLIFYDSIGSFVILFVDIMANFEVWNKSLIAYPFGLGRLEVLVGFALGASLIMVGFDLVLHFVEEFIILIVNGTEEHEHNSHHIHSGHLGIENLFAYESVLIITLIWTVVTSNYILAYDRITEMIEDVPKVKLGGLINEGSSTVRSNVYKYASTISKTTQTWSKSPTHLLTFCYSLYLMTLPILPETDEVNEIISLIVALLLCHTGWKLVKSLGGILMCSFPQTDYEYLLLKSRILERVTLLDFYRLFYTVEKFFITKFNYELYIVGIKLNMAGASNDDESRLLFEINRIVQKEISESDGKRNKIEITIDIMRA